ARTRAVSCPSPLDPPVTSATLPPRSMPAATSLAIVSAPNFAASRMANLPTPYALLREWPGRGLPHWCPMLHVPGHEPDDPAEDRAAERTSSCREGSPVLHLLRGSRFPAAPGERRARTVGGAHALQARGDHLHAPPYRRGVRRDLHGVVALPRVSRRERLRLLPLRAGGLAAHAARAGQQHRNHALLVPPS